MEAKEKHWTSELLTIFGLWLWKEKEYGHALLCIHGPQWGYKIGQQLAITWDDVLHKDDFEVKIMIDSGGDETGTRYINGWARESIEMAVSEVDFKNWEDSLYMDYRKDRPLTTSTLNRELKKHSDQFLYEMHKKFGINIPVKSLKSNAFQIAWAFKMLRKYHYSKKCFVEISKFMGHRTLKDTIKLLEVEPFDEIVFDFGGVYGESKLDFKLLEDKENVEGVVHRLIHDPWTRFKESITE